ncbi:MAG: HAD-IIIA family hydrolase [Acidimicrobiia bacterium]
MILLDRDGVLNVDLTTSVRRVEDLQIETGAHAGCEMLRSAGYSLTVISNQSAVGRGWMDRTTLDAVNRELDRRLGHVVDHWYVCTHAPTDHCRCRKPDTLLLEQAQADLGFELGATWFVVDAARDVEAAQRFGCRPALVRTGKGAATAARYPEVPVWDDLEAFARSLTKAIPAPTVTGAPPGTPVSDA